MNHWMTLEGKMRTILILGIFSLVFLGCKSKSNIQGNENITNQFAEELLSQPSEGKVALLSIKYNIEESEVESILDEYLSTHDYFYKLMKKLSNEGKSEQNTKDAFIINLNFKESIDALSSKYNIPKDKLAAVIIDFKMWTACEEKEY